MDTYYLIPPNDRYLSKKSENPLDGRTFWSSVSFDFLKGHFGCDHIDLSFVLSFEEPVNSLGLRSMVVLCGEMRLLSR